MASLEEDNSNLTPPTPSNSIEGDAKEETPQVVISQSWVSDCCGRRKVMSKGFIHYFVQVFFSLIVFAFAAAMIVIKDERSELWVTLIATIVGVHIPNPKLDENT